MPAALVVGVHGHVVDQRMVLAVGERAGNADESVAVIDEAHNLAGEKGAAQLVTLAPTQFDSGKERLDFAPVDAIARPLPTHHATLSSASSRTCAAIAALTGKCVSRKARIASADCGLRS